MRNIKFIAAFIFFIININFANAADLITLKEAQLPNAKGELKTRGISRGPGIIMVSPKEGIEVKSPFDFKLLFEPRGGVKIDLASVKVTYLKFPYVDLTERIKSDISASGIEHLKASVPAGEHSVRVSVKDIEGRESNRVINLLVVK